MTQIDSSQVRSNSIALFSFLKELAELRTKTVRRVDQYDEALWLSDLPKENTYCDCVLWRGSEDDARPEVWLEIKKPPLESPPAPEEELEQWLPAEAIADSSAELPELLDEIKIWTRYEGSEDGYFKTLRLQDHPEIKKKWEAYVEGQWWSWAEKDRRLRPVQEVYARLFSILKKQQRLGEQYEVVLGLGLLSWLTPQGHEIQRHLLAAQTGIAFDSRRGVITVGPAGEGARLALEQDMIDPRSRPDPDEIIVMEDQLEGIGDDIWFRVEVEAVLAGWVHSVSSQGRFGKGIARPERVLNTPQVDLAPAVILRKRTERSFIKAFEEIVAQLTEGSPVPPGTARFVSITEDPDQDSRDSDGGDEQTPAFGPGEVYFPLESNNEQRRILDRLSSHQGVLVQGPPGTGKSHTIVNLIAHLLATGQRVLVTSHAARALGVLKRYIRERVPDLAPLAVVLLGNDRESLEAMEDSVQGITERHNRWNAGTNSKTIEKLERELDQQRREESRALGDLRSLREAETYEHPRQCGNYAGTLKTIAARLRSEAEKFAWFEDQPPEDLECPLKSEEISEFLALLRDPLLAERESLYDQVPNEILLTPDQVSGLFDNEANAAQALRGVKETTDHAAFSALRNVERDLRQTLTEQIGALVQEAERITRHIQPWTERAVIDFLGDRDRIWREALETTRSHLSEIEERVRWADSTPVSGIGGRDQRAVRADAEELLAHLQGGGRLGFGPLRPAVVKRTLYLCEEVRIGGQLCSSIEQLQLLVERLRIEERVSELRRLWSSHGAVPSGSLGTQVAEYHDLCEPLDAALQLHSMVQASRATIGKIPELAEPTWHRLEEVENLRRALEAVLLQESLEKAESVLDQYLGGLGDLRTQIGSSDVLSSLFSAVETRNREEYSSTCQENSRRHSVNRRFIRRNQILSELKKVTPKFVESLEKSPSDSAFDQRAEQFEAAWDWARARSWVRRMSAPNREKQLHLALGSSRERIRSSLHQIAGAKAWSHCFAAMTEHQRQHLVAWSKAVRAIGKGTGKYAPQHRREARQHMNECREAIPAWVMPIYRVAETIKPGENLFDVVIIDEASQSGPEALLLTYLAKKLIVVGDDKQIAPDNVGVNRENVNQIRERHIRGLPHSDQYGVENSFFDLAEIRYQGRIRLREHFRCMPEIIQFSNNLSYRAEPLTPLRQYGSSRLQPVVSNRHVVDGYRKGKSGRVTNPPEAEAIVQAIVDSCRDEAYSEKTFGVISLLGSRQSQLIEEMLVERLGPEEIERRQIVCGDAYAFQGDERDVIYLSMVAATVDGRGVSALTMARDQRRFNVAASRARDQMVLFHTVTLNELSPHCLRHRLLEYCINPEIKQIEVAGLPLQDWNHLASVADRSSTQPPLPFDSWFELDVFLRIANRGFRVVPQYEIARYRIDLLVEGMDGRLAVECDGDYWHGPERYEADMSRQRKLERCGLQFWRIRESAFQLDPDSALEDLWEALERRGIHPRAAEHEPTIESKVSRKVVPFASPRKPAKQEPEVAEERQDDLEPLSGVSKEEDREALPKDPAALGEDDEGPGPTPSELIVPTPKFADASYTEWESRELPDLDETTVTTMATLLSEIASTEGPITAYRAYRHYAKASGRQRIRSLTKKKLNKALREGIHRHQLIPRNEYRNQNTEDLIIRGPNVAEVVVRPRGSRSFDEIPPSEVAELMNRIEAAAPFRSLPEETLFRKVLAFYEIKRLTKKIESQLRWIAGHRDDLLSQGPQEVSQEP